MKTRAFGFVLFAYKWNMDFPLTLGISIILYMLISVRVETALKCVEKQCLGWHLGTMTQSWDDGLFFHISRQSVTSDLLRNFTFAPMKTENWKIIWNSNVYMTFGGGSNCSCLRNAVGMFPSYTRIYIYICVIVTISTMVRIVRIST